MSKGWLSGRAGRKGQVLIVLILCSVLSAWIRAVPAEAAQVIDDEPRIFGPLESVHEVTGAGYRRTLDWVTTQGLTGNEVNAALWQASLSPGIYLLDTWVTNTYGNTDASYRITHDGEVSEVRLRQADFDEAWVSLGTYRYGSSEASVRSTDATGNAGEHLAWDVMRWTPVPSFPPNIETENATTTINEPETSGPEGFVVRFVGVGYHDDLLRAIARGVNATPSSFATWSAPLAAGTYRVEVYVPAQHNEAEVDYTVHGLDGSMTVPVSQGRYREDWVPLGSYRFGAAGVSVTSSDATGVAGQEIAWDAVRFIPQAREEGEQAHGEAGGPAPSAHTASPDLSPPKENTSSTRASCPMAKLRVSAEADISCERAEAAALEQRELIKFDVHPIFKGGPHDAYEIKSFSSKLKGYKLRYRCEPCLFMAGTVPAGTRIPATHRSRAEGDARSLVGKVLYMGSAFQLTVREGLHLPIRYTYRLLGHARIDRPIGCIVSVGHLPKACGH